MRMQVAVSAILVGLAQTALCLVAMVLGEDLVTIPVYVDPMECVIRVMETVTVCLVTQAPNVTTFAH